jgi:hypothetical protein
VILWAMWRPGHGRGRSPRRGPRFEPEARDHHRRADSRRDHRRADRRAHAERGCAGAFERLVGGSGTRPAVCMRLDRVPG